MNEDGTCCCCDFKSPGDYEKAVLCLINSKETERATSYVTITRRILRRSTVMDSIFDSPVCVHSKTAKTT